MKKSVAALGAAVTTLVVLAVALSITLFLSLRAAL